MSKAKNQNVSETYNSVKSMQKGDNRMAKQGYVVISTNMITRRPGCGRLLAGGIIFARARKEYTVKYRLVAEEGE